ncbi:hypothetical protein IWQ62_004572 [Dispira parvispora]|uniref:Cyclin N-terminal domain-containing protein n=1 Tax=Dispira parvispora TaxID=1520584 RepID=A0A9W8ALM9_9FUNG|nr:hypothetical protein IWQ62_004572 [Dispira parvispora]
MAIKCRRNRPIRSDPALRRCSEEALVSVPEQNPAYLIKECSTGSSSSSPVLGSSTSGSLSSSTSSSPAGAPNPRRSSAHRGLPPLPDFVANVCRNLNPSTMTLITCALYMERLRRSMPTSARGSYDTPYRIFLASLMIADKYLHDHQGFRTRTVADATEGLFNIQEVNRMESTFIALLKYRLWIKVDEIDSFLRDNHVEYHPRGTEHVL